MGFIDPEIETIRETGHLCRGQWQKPFPTSERASVWVWTIFIPLADWSEAQQVSTKGLSTGVILSEPALSLSNRMPSSCTSLTFLWALVQASVVLRPCWPYHVKWIDRQFVLR
jgi:hypothetical protein